MKKEFISYDGAGAPVKKAYDTEAFAPVTAVFDPDTFRLIGRADYSATIESYNGLRPEIRSMLDKQAMHFVHHRSATDSPVEKLSPTERSVFHAKLQEAHFKMSDRNLVVINDHRNDAGKGFKEPVYFVEGHPVWESNMTPGNVTHFNGAGLRGEQASQLDVLYKTAQSRKEFEKGYRSIMDSGRGVADVGQILQQPLARELIGGRFDVESSPSPQSGGPASRNLNAIKAGHSEAVARQMPVEQSKQTPAKPLRASGAAPFAPS